jgi:hypothetical protein
MTENSTASACLWSGRLFRPRRAAPPSDFAACCTGQRSGRQRVDGPSMRSPPAGCDPDVKNGAYEGARFSGVSRRPPT